MQLPAGPAQLKRFKDPVFRISNLYSIRTREGKVIPFRPRRQQLQVLDMLYRQKLKRVCILKARQLGFSTLLGIVCLDQLCWSVGRQVSLVDKTQEDARQKLKNIVALAYDSLHAELKARFLVDRANAGEFGVRFHEYDSAQTSTMYAATHARGGSNSLLWISNGAISRPPIFAGARRFSRGPFPVPRMAPLSLKRRGGVEGAVIYGRSLKRPSRRLRSRNSPTTGEWFSSPGQTTRIISTPSPRRLPRRRFDISPTSPGSALGRCPGINERVPSLACSLPGSIRRRSRSVSRLR